MKDLYESNRLIVLGAVGALILISLAAVFFASTPATGPGGRALPPVQQANIARGFIGKQPFGAWLLVCEDLTKNPAAAQSGAKRVCRTNSRVIVRGPNNAALLAAGLNVVMTDNHKGPGLLLRLPPAAGAADSIHFAVDKHAMFKIPLRCTKTECLAQGALPADAVTQMRDGKTLSILYTVKDAQKKDRKVRVDQMLHGFRQSYDAMTTAMSA